MLLINNKKVNVQDFIERIESITGKSINLDELKSNLEFTYNPSKKGFDLAVLRDQRMKVAKVLKTDDVLANFKVWDSNIGESVEFRFANRLPYENAKTPGTIIYDPKALEISGSGFNFEGKDLEKALYLYVHPSCYDSPFHETGKPYKYSHVNLKAESRRKLKEMNNTQKAFTHAMAIDETDLKITALGLNLDLIPHADADDIRAAIQEFALKNPEVYLEKTSTETLKFEGMILEAIDSGFVIQKEVGGVPSWEFGKGSRKGEQILIITDGTQDRVAALLTHLKRQIATYYPILASFNNDFSSDLAAEQYLSKLKNGASKNDVLPHNPSQELTLKNVVDYKSSQEFLKSNHHSGEPSSPANNKKFLEEVLSGNITEDNLLEELPKYLKKS